MAQWKRASFRVNAGTSGFIYISDSDRTVPAELGNILVSVLQSKLWLPGTREAQSSGGFQKAGEEKDPAALPPRSQSQGGLGPERRHQYIQGLFTGVFWGTTMDHFMNATSVSSLLTCMAFDFQ